MRWLIGTTLACSLLLGDARSVGPARAAGEAYFKAGIRGFVGTASTFGRPPNRQALMRLGDKNKGTPKHWPKPTWVLEGHEESADCVAISPDSKLLACGGEGGLIILWSLETGKEVGRLNVKSRRAERVFFVEGGKTILALTNLEGGTTSDRSPSA